MAEQQAGSHWAKDTVEEDRVETLIRKSGCWDQHIGVVDCMGDKRDWRACQVELTAFKQCMMKGQAALKAEAELKAAITAGPATKKE